MNLLRKILIPTVPVYQGITWLRNYCFDNDILKSKSYNFPVICVGNLSVGGTGKTPMIEYLIQLLKEDYYVGTLSRGYRRETKGFLLADDTATAKTVGDEPFQFYQKFSEIIVSVGEDRQLAIEQLLQLEKSPEVLLLDDAFQHRKVQAGLNILLTSYNDLYVNDMVLPTGNLREPKSGAKRADLIIVTKCPENISVKEQEKIKDELKIKSHQQLFFSSISYANEIISKEKGMDLEELKNKPFTLVTGIANPMPLVDYLNKKGFNFNHEAYKDHHDFTASDISKLEKMELVLTTEKDYVRLKDALKGNNVFYLPIASKILNAEAFDNNIKMFIKSF
ncbi:MAG: tetraacyldisaccharide 4'-kinase [Flavobacteriaceae bacterium]|nr:tetraacyldisaccharide 4'-kinase [Flavobacteriaceae bacterium]